MAPYNLTPAVCTYYILHELPLQVNLTVKQTKIVSKDKGSLVSVLSQIYYDYLPLACIGEARHADHNCDHGRIKELRLLNDRNSAQTQGLKCDPEQFMPILYKLFGLRWSGSFGGKSWRNITLAWMRRNELPPDLWVQQCVDFMHNNGYIFDKTPSLLEFASVEYSYLMTMRSTSSMLDVINRRTLMVPLLDVKSKSLLPESISDAVSYHPVQKYTPLKWGAGKITLEIGY